MNREKKINNAHFIQRFYICTLYIYAICNILNILIKMIRYGLFLNVCKSRKYQSEKYLMLISVNNHHFLIHPYYIILYENKFNDE